MTKRSVREALSDSTTVSTPARTTPSATRPAELDDRNWLERAYRQGGDRQIGQSLNVSASAVLRARKRLGITAAPPGRRKGATPQPVERLTLTPTLELIADRTALWQKHRVPATETTLITAIRALHNARNADTPHVYQDALIDIATSAALIHEHQKQVMACSPSST